MEQDKMKKQDRSLWILCLVESTVLMAITVFAIGYALFVSASTKLGPRIYVRITEYPDKLTYVIGKDNKLDFTGGKVNISSSPYRNEGDDIDMQAEMGGLLENISDEIDFTKEGVYIVRIKAWEDSCSFPIQVISPDYVE